MGVKVSRHRNTPILRVALDLHMTHNFDCWKLRQLCGMMKGQF